jgi:hypothetical protein
MDDFKRVLFLWSLRAYLYSAHIRVYSYLKFINFTVIYTNY